jgi:hypothetical protein
MTEEDFTEWKDNTRQSALEREVQRLRELSQKQSGKIGNLRRIVYFISFFFIVLFSILLAKGMLVFPGDDTNQVSITQQAPMELNETTTIDTNSIEKPDLYIPDTIPVPLRETKGVIYCVQIGAYTGIDLEEYKENLVSLQQDSYEGINQLTLGRFTNHDKANEFLAIIHQIGFHDAFIMSFKNGRRVQVKVQEPTDMQPESIYPAPAETSTPNSAIANDSISSNL